MALLPIFKDPNQNLMLMQNKWKSILDPLVSNQANSSSILKNIALKTGANVVNHKLGYPLTGWSIIRKRASADIYDSQDSNQSPALTLILVSSAPVVCDIEVF